jgi:hypothetical protein
MTLPFEEANGAQFQQNTQPKSRKGYHNPILVDELRNCHKILSRGSPKTWAGRQIKKLQNAFAMQNRIG